MALMAQARLLVFVAGEQDGGGGGGGGGVQGGCPPYPAHSYTFDCLGVSESLRVHLRLPKKILLEGTRTMQAC